MYQKFFTDTIQTRYIKSLLLSNPVPLYECVSEGDYIVKGVRYIYKHSVIECTRTGYIYTYYTPYIRSSEISPPEGNLIVNAEGNSHMSGVIIGDQTYTTGVDAGEYISVCPYLFGESYPLFTDTFNSPVNYYDPETHYQLGNFLRALRNNLNINLMPFYNCFGYDLITDVQLTTKRWDGAYDGVNYDGYKKQGNSKVRVLSIPIRFNQEYTIAINSDVPVTLKSFIHDGTGMVSVYEQPGVEYSQLLIETQTGSKVGKTYQHVKFSEPLYYMISNKESDAIARLSDKYPSRETFTQDEIDAELKEFQLKQKDLRLFIQMSTNTTSIVVLEGHYRNFGQFSTRHLRFPAEYYDPEIVMRSTSEGLTIWDRNKMLGNLTPKQLNEQLISNLGLLQFNTNTIYAFSDRLIEYLLLNVIDSQDDIAQNVVRVQEYTNFTLSKGIFDNELRARLFYSYMGFDIYTSKYTYPVYRDIDINGFVDKNMEKFITRGLDV